MTTKSGNLSLREKQRIEDLIKCSRERKRKHLVDKLSEKRNKIEAPFDKRIEVLQRKADDIRIEREKAVLSAGYGKIHERGCYDTHPDLDKFDSETNAMLISLWKTSEPTEEQFTDGAV